MDFYSFRHMLPTQKFDGALLGYLKPQKQEFPLRSEFTSCDAFVDVLKKEKK